MFKLETITNDQNHFYDVWFVEEFWKEIGKKNDESPKTNISYFLLSKFETKSILPERGRRRDIIYIWFL